VILFSPKDTDLYLLRSLTYCDLGNWQKAEIRFTKTLELYNSAGLYTYRQKGILYRSRGECRLELKKYELGISDAEISIARYKYELRTYILMSNIYSDTEQYNKALEITDNLE